jgi:hypothetical protein
MIAIEPPRAHDHGRSGAPAFLVQLRYEIGVPGAAPDGWLTVAEEGDFAAAVHEAARAYAARRDPLAGPPMGVRVRTEEQLRRLGGDEAVRHARLAVARA